MELDSLDRRIAGALMVAPRASWRQVALALDEPERTVARHGADLLESGAVAVVGVQARRFPVVVAVRTAPGTTRVASRALSGRPDTSFVYEVTGSADCLAELMLDRHEVHDQLTADLPGVVGVQQIVSSPILRYFKTLREWEPDLLTTAERERLRRPLWDPTQFGHYPPLDRRDQQVIAALHADGRATAESVGRIVGVSEATARRRIAWLIDHAVLHVRALVAPPALGLHVEALLWIKAPPHHVEEIGVQVAQDARSRYVAALAGEHQLLADFTLSSLRDLYDLTARAPWASAINQLTTSLVLQAPKRGGRLTDLVDERG